MNIELFFKVRFLKVAFVGGNSCLHQRLAFFPTLKGDSGVIWWVSAINSNNNNSYCSKNPVKQTLFLPHCADEGTKTQCLSDLPKVAELVDSRSRSQSQAFVASKAEPCSCRLLCCFWQPFSLRVNRTTRAPFLWFSTWNYNKAQESRIHTCLT